MPRYTYASSYRLRTVSDQIRRLLEVFPHLQLSPNGTVWPQVILPAEGLFVFPPWQLIASSYGEAVGKVLLLIAGQRTFCNYLTGRLDERYLQPHPMEARWLATAALPASFQKVSAQFGQGYANRWRPNGHPGYATNEYGLGAFTVGCMLLTHPERLQDYDDLWLCCPGDRCRLHLDSGFTHMPCFQCVAGEIGIAFDAVPIDCVGGHYGWATAFLSTAQLAKATEVAADKASW